MTDWLTDHHDWLTDWLTIMTDWWSSCLSHPVLLHTGSEGNIRGDVLPQPGLWIVIMIISQGRFLWKFHKPEGWVQHNSKENQLDPSLTNGESRSIVPDGAPPAPAGRRRAGCRVGFLFYLVFTFTINPRLQNWAPKHFKEWPSLEIKCTPAFWVI